MSMRLVCDCEHHEQDEYDTLRAIAADDYLTLGDKDICSDCLLYCRRWRPYVNEPRSDSPISKAFATIYEPVIRQEIEAQATFNRIFGK